MKMASKILAFCGFIFVNCCFANITIVNDTLDTYDQQFPVSATYKICDIVDTNNIEPICIGGGTTRPLRYGNQTQITQTIPDGYQIVIESISVYDKNLKPFYNQQVQIVACTSSGPVIHIGAYAPSRMVSCNFFNYPQ